MPIRSDVNLNITDISLAFYSCSPDWGRPKFEKRRANGIAFFTKGRNRYFYDGHSEDVGRGDILILPQSVPYSGVKLTEGDTAFFIVDFHTAAEDELEKLPLATVIRGVDYELYCKKFSEIVSAWESNAVCPTVECKALLYGLLNGLLTANVSRSERAAEPVLAYMRNNFTDPELTVSRACEALFISETQLRRKLRGAVGMSPKEYVASLRLEKARNMLICGAGSVEYIAGECGYSSQFYFSQRFKQRYGVSPLKYRREYNS